jgi:hypothetical protein
VTLSRVVRLGSATVCPTHIGRAERRAATLTKIRKASAVAASALSLCGFPKRRPQLTRIIHRLVGDGQVEHGDTAYKRVQNDEQAFRARPVSEHQVASAGGRNAPRPT